MDKLVPLFFLAMVFVNVHTGFCQQNSVEHGIKSETNYTAKHNDAITSLRKTNREVQTRGQDRLLKNAEFQQYRNKLQKHRKIRQLSNKAGTRKVCTRVFVSVSVVINSVDQTV